MSRRFAFASLLVLITLVATGRADIDIEVANGQKVRGTIDPVDELETLTACIPAGATLSVSVKGKKVKGGTPAPNVTFKVLDQGDTEISAGLVSVKGVGAKLKKLPIPVSGKYRVVIQASAVGNYEAKVKWKSSKKFKETVDTSGGQQIVGFAIDPGAKCKFQAKASKRSDAEPVMETVDIGGDDPEFTFPAPEAGASKHKQKDVVLGDFGNHLLFVSSTGPGGDVDVSIGIKAPKTDKKQIVEITDAKLASDDARGKVIGPAGGNLAITEGELGDLLGAAVFVPPGALGKPSAIIIGSGLGVPVDGTDPGGPAVFFGPDGLQFGVAATIILPFNPALFNEAGDVQVAVKDEDGNIALLDVTDFTVDFGAGLITAIVSHFSEYQAVGSVDRVVPPMTVPGDLNGDQFADIVIATGSAGGAALNPNNVQVIFGSDTLPSALSTATSVDAFFASGDQFDLFGQSFVVADLSGDGQDDLIVADQFANNIDGAVHIFFGGAGFAGSINPFADADVTIGGVSQEGFGNSICVGDVIGDGRLDLVVTSFGSSPDFKPFIYVFDAAVIVNGLSSNASQKVTGEGSTVLWVRACGNLFGDTKDDIVSLQQGGDGGNDVYVFAGGSALSLLDQPTLASAGAVITAAESTESLGFVSLIADVIGDSTGDLILFDPLTGGFSGAVWLFQGGASFGSKSTSDADVKINPSLQSWGVEVMLAADLDGNGRDELVIPDSNTSLSVSLGGAAFVFRTTDLIGTIQQTGASRRIGGSERAAGFGTYAGKGDVNGDGRMDVYVASPFTFGPPGDPSGVVYLFYGVPDLQNLPATDSAADVTIQGQTRELLGNRDFDIEQ